MYWIKGNTDWMKRLQPTGQLVNLKPGQYLADVLPRNAYIQVNNHNITSNTIFFL